MNTLILRALDDDDVLRAALLVAQQIEADIPVPFYLSVIHQWQQNALEYVDLNMSVQQQVRQLNQFFYTELAFAGQPKNLLASDYARMDQVILYRNGCAVCLCILYCHLARALGIDASGVSFPGHYLIRVKTGNNQLLFMDALSGSLVSWSALENLYLSVTDADPEEGLPEELVAPSDSRSMLIRLLQNLKGAYIRQEQFQQALTVSDLLVTLSPDDPYERRGRGWLLQQLNCHGGAYADYQYYIRQCPRDPAAHLLKLQLRSHSLKSQVLH